MPKTYGAGTIQPDPLVYYHQGGSWDYGTGQPWYIANWHHGGLSGADTVQIHQMVAVPFIAPARPGKIDQIGITTFSANAGAKTLIGIYSNKSPTDLYPYVKLYGSAELDTSAGGTPIVTGVNLTLDPKELYWAVVHCGGAGTTIRHITSDQSTGLLGISNPAGDGVGISLQKSNIYYTETPLPSTFPAGAFSQATAPAIALRFAI